MLDRRNVDLRTIKTEEISKAVREMCIEANHVLSADMKNVFDEAEKRKNLRLEDRF